MNTAPDAQQTIPVSTPPDVFNQAQLQAQAVQLQRIQQEMAKKQQTFANRIAVVSSILQGLTLTSATGLMLAIARYALTH